MNTNKGTQAGSKLIGLNVMEDYGQTRDVDAYVSNPAIGINSDASFESLGSLVLARLERLENLILLIQDAERYHTCDISHVTAILLPMVQESRAISAAFVNKTLEVVDQAVNIQQSVMQGTSK